MTEFEISSSKIALNTQFWYQNDRRNESPRTPHPRMAPSAATHAQVLPKYTHHTKPHNREASKALSLPSATIK